MDPITQLVNQQLVAASLKEANQGRREAGRGAALPGSDATAHAYCAHPHL